MFETDAFESVASPNVIGLSLAELKPSASTSKFISLDEPEVE
jgi:hypothetical protein